MRGLLMVVGALWAILGFGNIVMMPWANGNEGVLGFGLVFNVMVFVLPGLVVYGIGSRMSKPAAASVVTAAPATPGKTVEERLTDLQSLKDKSLIDEDEFQTRKRFILRDV